MTASRKTTSGSDSLTKNWRATRWAHGLVLSVVTIHHLMVIFVLFGWLIPARDVLIFHVTLVPAIVVHWRFNHDRCILTNLENWLRHDDESRPGIAEQEPFVGQLLSRVYRRKVSFATTQAWAHTMAIVPWGLGIMRLKGML